MISGSQGMGVNMLYLNSSSTNFLIESLWATLAAASAATIMSQNNDLVVS